MDAQLEYCNLLAFNRADLNLVGDIDEAFAIASTSSFTWCASARATVSGCPNLDSTAFGAWRCPWLSFAARTSPFHGCRILPSSPGFSLSST